MRNRSLFLVERRLAKLHIVSLGGEHIGERVISLDGVKLDAWAFFLEGIEDIALPAT